MRFSTKLCCNFRTSTSPLFAWIFFGRIATVDRFKAHISHWEIWNEPNLPVYWKGPKDHLRPYIHLLSLARAAALKADPDCYVLNGGLTEPIVEDISHFYENGGKEFTDII